MGHIDEPIQLISISSDGKLHVLNDAKFRLASLMKEKVSVVTCVGQYRQGKSYLMSRLYGKNKSFKIGSTSRGETKGVWMMTKLHPYRNDITVVYLDTEGLFDIKHSNTNFDAKLFALAWLCSTKVILNVKNVLDSNNLDSLNKALILAAKWSVQDDNKSVITPPEFHFVIRDSQLEMVDDKGMPVSDEEYLENILQNEECLSANGLINELITKRYLHTLCLPAEKNLLKKLDEASDNDLNPDFIKQFANFKSKVNIAKPFQVNDMAYTMKDWWEHVNLLVKDQDKTPNIRASSRDVALQVAMDDFAKATEGLKELVPMLPGEFMSRLNKCVETILHSCKAFEDDVVKVKLMDERMKLQKLNEDKFEEAETRKREEEYRIKLEKEMLAQTCQKEEAERRSIIFERQAKESERKRQEHALEIRRLQEDHKKKERLMYEEQKRQQEQLEHKEEERRKYQEEAAKRNKELEDERKRQQKQLECKEEERRKYQVETAKHIEELLNEMERQHEKEQRKEAEKRKEHELKEMQAKVEEAEESSNKLKAGVATGAAAVGTAAVAGVATGVGIFFAPFTAGLSLILGGAAGAAVLGAGAGGGIGYGISRMIRSSKKKESELDGGKGKTNETELNVLTDIY